MRPSHSELEKELVTQEPWYCFRGRDAKARQQILQTPSEQFTAASAIQPDCHMADEVILALAPAKLKITDIAWDWYSKSQLSLKWLKTTDVASHLLSHSALMGRLVWQMKLFLFEPKLTQTSLQICAVYSTVRQWRSTLMRDQQGVENNDNKNLRHVQPESKKKKKKKKKKFAARRSRGIYTVLLKRRKESCFEYEEVEERALPSLLHLVLARRSPKIFSRRFHGLRLRLLSLAWIIFKGWFGRINHAAIRKVGPSRSFHCDDE